MTIAWIPATVANAQPQESPSPEFKGGPRPMPTVDELAQQRANAMDHELTLTEKQYKKILKYYKAEVEKEKYYEKQDKKLKKILTAEQYGKWRTKHPVEHLPMPNLEFE